VKSLRIESPGLLTTVQDLGRPGHGPLGVSASGAADPVALRLGNLLVRNPHNSAALEMTLLGGDFVFSDGASFTLTGADFGATLNGQPVALWQTHWALPGEVLRVGATRDHARCYLCVAGGFVVPSFLASASTHLLSGLGGLQGRALRKGDVIQLGEPLLAHGKRNVRSGVLDRLHPRRTLRLTTGAQAEWFELRATEHFFSSSYVVTEEANRMGLRLQGPSIRASVTREMITEGVALGAIQVPDSGQPIILFVEQQTTGGYPKIANVITADLASVGQLRPRDKVRFELVSFDQARALLIEQERLLASGELIEDGNE